VTVLDTLLRAAFGLNIVILVPVVGSLLLMGSAPTVAVFEDKVPESAGLRLLVASLWAAILVCSVFGLIAPRAFVGVLLLQVVYKSLYLGLFVVPQIRSEGWGSVSWGVSSSFLLIIGLWPALIWAAWKPT
jgi:hypothetical protein